MLGTPPPVSTSTGRSKPTVTSTVSPGVHAPSGPSSPMTGPLTTSGAACCPEERGVMRVSMEVVKACSSQASVPVATLLMLPPLRTRFLHLRK